MTAIIVEVRRSFDNTYVGVRKGEAVPTGDPRVLSGGKVKEIVASTTVGIADWFGTTSTDIAFTPALSTTGIACTAPKEVVVVETLARKGQGNARHHRRRQIRER